VFCTNGHADQSAGRWHYGADAWLYFPEDRTDAPRPRPESRRRQEQAHDDALDPAVLSDVYSALLALLPLRPAHADYLKSRGAIDYTVAQAQGYGSLPLGYTETRRVTETLTRQYGARLLARVPGFPHVRGRLTFPTASARYDAFLIPARDERGRITGVVRRTTRDASGTRGKYQFLPGAHSGAMYTVAGSAWKAGPVRELRLVEGTHKGYVAAEASGRRVFALPALHVSDAHLAALRRLAPDVVVLCLDADRFRNPHVAAAELRALAKLLTLPGVEVRIGVWEEVDGKGLDDLHVAGRRPRLRDVPRHAALTRRSPEPTPAPGPVPAGTELMETQEATRAVIHRHLRHPREQAGQLLVVAAGPGTGKSTAAITELVRQGKGRILTATHTRAEEIAAAYPAIRAVRGRNADNCQRIDVVQAARQKGYDPALAVCQRCPVRDACTADGYYSQFRGRGVLVGPVEFVQSPEFLRGGGAVVLDDAPLDRALIDERHATAAETLTLAAAVGPGPLRELLTVVQRAVDALRTDAAGHFTPPRIAAAAWDCLARAAGSADRLLALIDALRDQDAQDFGPAGGVPEAADFDALPPAIIARLVQLLRRERDSFAAGDEWNSGLTLSPAGLELRTLRTPVLDAEKDRPLLSHRPVLVLDATPLSALIDAFARTHGLERLPDYRPTVALPTTVTVTQIADRSFGKTALGQKRTRPDGTLVDTGIDQAIAALLAARHDYPGDREAVVCPKGLRDAVIAATGLPPARVLSFHAARGLNAVQDADVLYVIGRPQEPTQQALALAHVLHQGEEPVRADTVLKRLPYAGYVAPDGQGRAFDVLGFADDRVDAIFEQARTAELWQAIHRARPYRVGTAQGDLFAPASEAVARDAQARQRLRIVLLTNQPVPELPVHELIYTPAEQAHPDLNDRRHQEATERVAVAVAALAADGQAVSVRAVHTRTGGSFSTIARALREIVGGVTHPKERENYLPCVTPPTNCRAPDERPPDQPLDRPPVPPETARSGPEPPAIGRCARDHPVWYRPDGSLWPCVQCGEAPDV
jgi:hypothetical protein